MRWVRESAGSYRTEGVQLDKLNSGELGTWVLFTPWVAYGFDTMRDARSAYEVAYDEHERTGVWPPLIGGRTPFGVEWSVVSVTPGVHVRTPPVYDSADLLVLRLGGGPLVAVDRTPVELPSLPGLWLGITCRARNGMAWKSWVSAERPVVRVAYGEGRTVSGVDLTEPSRDDLGNVVLEL